MSAPTASSSTTPAPAIGPRMLLKPEVMKLLDVSDRTLEKYIASNKFPPSLRLGKHSRWTEEVVLRWLERQLEPQLNWEPSKRGARKPARSPAA